MTARTTLQLSMVSLAVLSTVAVTVLLYTWPLTPIPLIHPSQILPYTDIVANYTCSDKWCTEFLSPEYTGRCEEKYPERVFLKSDESCRFMNGSQRAPVALVSFPGSGNTWVRGLLEQATGICTG